MPTPSIHRFVPLASLLAACTSTPSGGDAGAQDAFSGNDVVHAACQPSAACMASPACLGLTNNSGNASFGLRVAELDISAPRALAQGPVGHVTAGAVMMGLPACNLSGSAAFNWLLQFANGELTTGSAVAVPDPTMGYSFGTTPPSAQVATTLAGDGSFDATFPNVTVAVSGMGQPAFPFRSLHIHGTVSADHDCIGTYNAAGLDPANSCLPDSTHAQFITTGNTMEGFISLADADMAAVGALGESLCVVLSGDATTYGDGAAPIAHCKRDTSGNITFQGDWCAASNAAATSTCADALHFAATFAASSVTIR